jgi:hypothetical protein
MSQTDRIKQAVHFPFHVPELIEQVLVQAVLS